VGEILCRYRVNLTGNTSSHQEIPSMVPSRTPSAPAVSTPDTASKPEEKQLLTFYITGEDALLEKAVAAFNQQSETVEILPVKLSQTMTADQLAKLKKENNCPDLVLMTHSEMTLAAADQQLTNLSSLGLSKWNNKIDPTFLEKTQIGKATYGIPLGGVTSCLACNDELLYRAKAGVPATYEELIANAKLLRDTLPGVTPIGLTTDIADSRSMAEEFSMLLSGYGGALFTPDYESAAFYSQGGIHALAQLKTLQEEKLIADYVVRKDFYNEKIGYGIASSADYAKTFGKQAKANYTAAPLVMPGGGEAASYMELYSFCIPAGTSKAVRKAAFSFITYYFENPQYSVDLCQKKGWVPALLQAQTDESYNTPEWQVFIDTAKTARVIPPIACYPTIESYLAECVSSVLSGTDPETALEKAWNKTENRLARK
ncbi:MAG: extracellular solute-binding protein, partial [Clostridia bacterium]|nr:extracellular solute-binding protein [Clostridia bacterium]